MRLDGYMEPILFFVLSLITCITIKISILLYHCIFVLSSVREVSKGYALLLLS